MKIVYCIKGTYNSAGMERILANMANYLADKLGYDVHIITTEQRGRQPFYPLSGRISFHDLDIRYWDLPEMPFFKRKLLFYYKQLIHKKKLAAVLEKLGPAITVSMFDEEAAFLYQIPFGGIKLLAAYFSKNVEIDFVRSHGGGMLKLFRAKQLNRRNEKLVRKYSRFITLTYEDAALWGDIGNILVIPNAVSFYPVVYPDYSTRRVISVGRMDPQKGFDLLIMAWEQVVAACPGWKLSIFGSGPYHSQLQEMIATRGIGDSVALLPAVSDIRSEYLASSVYVLSSRYEGLPMALLEAMSCGLPVAAFRCPCGPADVISDRQNGLLVAPGDTDTLAKKIIELLNNLELREQLGKQAKKTMLDYSEEKIMEQWDNLFRQLTITNNKEHAD